MSNKSLIYVIDDDEENIEIIQSCLNQDEFEMVSFTNAKQCLFASENKAPQLYLSDVNMPEINGFEFCEALKRTNQLSHVPVIFISALDSTEDVLQGYNVGCIDYITRPFRPKEFNLKVSKTLALYKQLTTLEKRAIKAKNTAFKAMNDSERMKMVLLFMDGISSINDPTLISHKFFNILDQFNIKSSIYIRSVEQEYFFSHDEVERPMENHLLKKFVHALPNYIDKTGRFKEFNGKMIITFEHAALLIKNYNKIAQDDILDFLTFLLSVINNKLSAISLSMIEVQQRQSEVNQAIELSTESLDQLKERTKEYEKKIVRAMDHVLTELNVEFSRLNLIEDEEEKLISIVESAMKELTQLFCSGVELEHQFENVIDKFTALLKSNY